MLKYKNFGLLATAMLSLAAGCATERPPRSTVQPNILKKSDLEGTWHYLQTVVDAPPTNGSAFIGLSSELMKIKFDAQEDFLYARRSYEQIKQSEDEHLRDSVNYKAPVVLAAWRIRSHFDIIRDFNSTTGEQTNRIIESMERPWYQREFIRVDWSQNNVTDYVGLGLNFFFDDVTVQPVSYWQSDPSHPDALHLERSPEENGKEGFKKGEALYLDVTNQSVLTPATVSLCFEEAGQKECVGPYPKCLFDSWYPMEECASQKIKIRHSFAKVGPSHQYEPRLWDGTQMERFGVWDIGLRRITWNRQYGATNSGLERKAARFNLWEESYKSTDNGAQMPIPMKDRKTRKIPYYALGSYPVSYGKDSVFPEGTDLVYPPYLYDAFTRMIAEWDDAYRLTVASLKGIQCDKDAATGRIKGECAVDKIFIPCHSPVRVAPAADADDPVCAEGLTPDLDADGGVVVDKNGNPVLHARQGDARRTFVYWVHQQQNGGPLGYGPGHYDLETGETISATAYVYGSAVDTYAARSRDLMLLCNSELSKEEYTAGLNVQDSVGKSRYGLTAREPSFSDKEVLGMSTAMNFDYAKGFSAENGYPSLSFTSPKAFKRSFQNRQDAIYKNYWQQISADSGKGERGIRKLIGTPIEKMMITPEHMAIGGVRPNRQFDSLSDFEKQRVSPLRWRALSAQREADRLKAETVGLDFATFDESGACQNLPQIKKKYGLDDIGKKSDEIYRDLREQIYIGVTLHEIGHNMGLRHNFRGSYDSMNYFPNYWKVRTEAMQHPDVALGADPMKKSDGKLHPRYVNIAGGRESKWERDQGVREEQYSSIMDYGADFNSDLRGLGLYDRAHIKFSYGELVEVFTANNTDAVSLGKLGSIQDFQGALGFPSALQAAAGLKSIPYTTYPSLFKGGWQGMYQRKDVPFSEIKKCTVGSGNDQTEFDCDEENHPMVPYYFCSDEFAGNLTCQRFDGGADIYEQTADIVSRYQNYYIMNNFKRDRLGFATTQGYYDRIRGRYFDPLRRALTWYVLLRTSFQEYLTRLATYALLKPEEIIEYENRFFVDESEWGNFTAGVHLGFETIGKVITTPQAGIHNPSKDATGNTIWVQGSDQLVPTNNAQQRTIDTLDGKFIDTAWDHDRCGYYAFDECQTRVGYMIDKTIALEVLGESVAQFTGYDTAVDQRRYAIGYVIPYKAQIAEKFGAIIANDSAGYFPWFGTNRNGYFDVVQPSWAFDNPTLKPKAEGNGVVPYLDASTGFSIQIGSGIHALRSFPLTFDHDFIDTTKVFVVGNGEATTSDATILAEGTDDPAQLVGNGGNKEWFYVKDPSGKVFAAHSTPATPTMVLSGTGPQKDQYQLATVPLRSDTGVRMLISLRAMAAAYDAAKKLPANDKSRVTRVAFTKNEYEKFRQNIEVMRSLHNAFGYGNFRTDAPFVPPG